MAEIKNPALPKILQHSDILITIGVVGVLAVMVIPVAPWMMDMLLCVNITITLLILIISFYILKPLDFSVFPSILLIVTIFRLALNVASTRLVLLHGNEGTSAAGKVIQTFGQFVVGGNYVVGMVIFTILVIINFVVITKGANRIAEVAARFTLDAMPGKQMAIDADLNAGLVDENEARLRRRQIEAEADYYGDMDGAAKFVRGDAIAGIIITLVNIIGGFVIGSVMFGMALKDALTTYTLLTVGDGLVTQIPALIVSTSAGLIVTRATSESNLGRDITNQMLQDPKAISIASGILFFFAWIPGFPKLPFLVISTLLGLLAYNMFKQRRTAQEAQHKAKLKKEKEVVPERVESLLPLDPVELEVGYGLISLVDVNQGGELLDRIKAIRRQNALEMGMVIPPIRIRDNLQLSANSYSILIKGVEVVSGEIMPDRYLAMDPGTAEGDVEGLKTHEPAFGLPALWILKKDREKAQNLGYTVVDSSTVIATHLSEVLRKNAAELLGRQEVQNLLNTLQERSPRLVEDLIPNLLSLGVVVKVLQNLLKERVSIRDLQTIVETLADYASLTKDADLLTEYVRQALARSITKQYLSAEGKLHTLMLDPKLEQNLANYVHKTDQGVFLAIEPKMAQELLTKLSQSIEKIKAKNLQPIILCSPALRLHFWRLIERFIPGLVVLSHNEIPAHITLESLGMISL